MVRLGEPRGAPVEERRIGEVRRDVGRRRRADRQAVGGDPGRHRREEHVRQAVVAEEPGAARRRRQRPERLDAGEIGADRLVRLEAAIASPQVHRAGGPQRGEARVHLGDEAARQRPRRAGRRPEPAVGMALGQRLGDGEAVPEHAGAARLLDAQRRHGAGRAEVGEHRREGGRVHRRGVQRHRQAEAREHQPAAQGPARMAAVADGEMIGHRPPLPRRRPPGQARRAAARARRLPAFVIADRGLGGTQR